MRHFFNSLSTICENTTQRNPKKTVSLISEAHRCFLGEFLYSPQKTVSVSPVEEPFPEAQSEPPQTQPEEAPHREKKQTEAACSYGEYGWVKLTSAQYRNLAEEMGEAELLQCISYIDEAAQSTQNKNRWKDWFLLLRRCHRDHWHRRPTKEPIPKGASGTLGDAELEAIQRVLREE